MSIPISNGLLTVKALYRLKGTAGAPLMSALLAVAMFSLTAPMTELALTELSAEFVTFFRSGIAGIGSLLLAGYLEWQLPARKDAIRILIGGLAVALVFPYTLAVAVLQWQASDLGVILALIPLLTASIATLVFREKQNTLFWLCTAVGSLLLVWFAYRQSNGSIHWSVFVMLLAAGIGYSFGGQAAKTVGGFKTICWMTIFYLPVTMLGLGYESPRMALNITEISTSNLMALLYLTLISQWLGFHCWYGAMAKVGIARAGQVQLLQPFFTLLFSIPLLGATLNVEQFIFAGLITITVIVSVKYKP